MKLAQEIRAGNVIMQGKDPMVVLRTNTAAVAATRPPCA
jgi:elongation factor P